MQDDLNPESTTFTPNETLNRITKKEAIPGCLCSGLYIWDMLRFFGHEPPDNIPSGQLNLGIPRQTEGIAGLIDQNMGDLGMTLALIYVARIPVEIGAKVYEAIWNKKVNPRIKLCLAVLMGMAYPTMMELGIAPGAGNTKYPLDLFGVIVAGIAVTAGFETAEFLSTRPPNYLNDKFIKIQNRIKPIAEAAANKFSGLSPD